MQRDTLSEMLCDVNWRELNADQVVTSQNEAYCARYARQLKC